MEGLFSTWVWAGMGLLSECQASMTSALPEAGSPFHPENSGLGGTSLCRPLVVRLWQCTGAAAEDLPCPLQHYTSDADGLCTRLIKPKVMEGTVAAQDEFFRSEWHPHPQFSLAYSAATQASWHCPSLEALETSRVLHILWSSRPLSPLL